MTPISRLLPRLAAPFAICIALSLPAHGEAFKDAFPDMYAQVFDEYKADTGALELQHGTFKLAGGIAELALPDAFYALNAKDAQYVLEKLWDNPPDDSILGLIMPAGLTPFDDASWAATITFDDIGYVSDEDAAGYDYGEMLASMQQDARDANADREKDGFSTVDLLGWAAQPHYDKETRKLYWAKRLQFGDSENETLNYNIRVLGRKGVLELNFIARMDQLAEIEGVVPQVLQMVNFTQGNRYADFIPGTDTIAAVGIGGLIAGKLAAKAGLLVLALAFLKKGVVLILLPAMWVWRKIKAAIFGRAAKGGDAVSGTETAQTDTPPPNAPPTDPKDGSDT